MKTYRVTVPAWLSFTVEAASEEEALTLAVETSEDLEIAEPFPAILEDSYINVPKSVETECQALEPHHVSKAMMIS